MKKIKSFLYVGKCDVDGIPSEVNEYISQLGKKGIEDIEIKINSTCSIVQYVLKWNE